MTIMTTAPFRGQTDVNLGVAYISVVIIFFLVRKHCSYSLGLMGRPYARFLLHPLQITLFPLGGFRLITKDFEGPDLEDEEVKEALRLKQQRWLLLWKRKEEDERTSGRPPSIPEGSIEEGRFEKKDALVDSTLPAGWPALDNSGIVETAHDVSEQRAHHRLYKHHARSQRVSFQPESTEDSPIAVRTAFNSAAPTLVARTEDGKETPPTSPTAKGVPDYKSRSTSPSLFGKFRSYLRTLPGPATVTLIVSFTIAIITPLKALFVPLTREDGTSIIPFAPDGAPPLSFLLDTATFLGNASVPLGLVCIGAALAKLRIPKRVKDLPLGAISALAFGRLILQPVVAVFIIQGLVRVGVINQEDKVLRFVML